MLDIYFRIPSRLFACLLLAFGFAGSATPAHACSCEHVTDPDAFLRETPVIFTGRAAIIEPAWPTPPRCRAGHEKSAHDVRGRHELEGRCRPHLRDRNRRERRRLRISISPRR